MKLIIHHHLLYVSTLRIDYCSYSNIIVTYSRTVIICTSSLLYKSSNSNSLNTNIEHGSDTVKMEYIIIKQI